jgi:purine-binding chemotaxis protein CheW
MAAAIEATEALPDPSHPSAWRAGEARSPIAAPSQARGRDEDQLTSVVSFVLSDRRYVIETRYVCEIVSGASISPLPGTPDHVVGIHDLRGQLLPVFDLRDMLGLVTGTPASVAWTIVCGESQAEFLILADRIYDVMNAPLDAVSLDGQSGIDESWIRGITPDGTTVVDGAALLNDRRFFLGDMPTDHGDEDAKGPKP